MELNPYPHYPILIVDDEEEVLKSYRFSLHFNGIDNIITCNDSREAMTILGMHKVSLILLDLLMPHKPGSELLTEINREFPRIPVIVITGSNKVETAVDCMKMGAMDYLVKPVDDNNLYATVKIGLGISSMEDEISSLRSHILSGKLENPEVFADIITINPELQRIFQYCEAIAESPKPVLITGESGTGKELIAQALHTLSNVKGSFTPVNMGGLDDTMFSDTLFGHRKGAYTGADTHRKGLIEQAVGGTLFLDEIGDLEPGSQAKMLRLLQEGEYYPLGDDEVKYAQVRLIFATNADLKAKMKAGEFRQDLYYRILTHHVHIPPLRERMEDVPILVEYLMDQAAATLGKAKPTAPPELMTLLGTYYFPGNVRELQSMIFNAVSQHKEKKLSLSYFKEYMTGQRIVMDDRVAVPGETFPSISKRFSYFGPFPTLKEVEEFLYKEAIQKSRGNQVVAAQLLGVSPSTISRWCCKSGERETEEQIE